MEKQMSQEEMVKEAVEEAKKAAEEAAGEAGEEADRKEAGAEDTAREEGRTDAGEEAGQEPEPTGEPAEKPEEESEGEPAEDSPDEPEEDTEAAEDEEGEEPKKKKLFERKPKKDKKDEQIETLTDKLARQMAEFDNFRKRTEKEKAAMYEVGAKSVIEKILPVVDNFERGLSTVPEEEKEAPFVQGVTQIYKQLMTTLEGLDVKPIEAVGQPFNPDLHNAVMHVEDEELGENVVAEEFQKGYTYRGSVVRHSMVKVAN